MAIRDQGYTPYDGDLSKGTAPALVIATTGLSLYWGYLRTKLLFIVLMIMPVLFLVISFAERVFTKMFMGGAGAEADKINGFYEYAFGYIEIWMLAILLAAAGCGVVADDMRHRTIQLYFSKPITRLDYVGGKFLSLVMLGGLVTLLPMVIIGLVRMVVFLPSTSFKGVAANIALLGLFNVILLVFMSLVVMALSCLTSRRGYVVLAFLGTILVPSVISTITSLVRKGEPWTDLLSLVGSLAVGLKVMVGYEGVPQPGELQAAGLPEYMSWAPWVVVATVALGACAIIHWRTGKLEGIA